MCDACDLIASLGFTVPSDLYKPDDAFRCHIHHTLKPCALCGVSGRETQ